jgi:beta-N-acetylhexosaminidase
MTQSLLLLGINGTSLTSGEAERFRRLLPAGYILFSRNIADARQTRKLTDDLREISNFEPIIAIDQEGGRVTRTTALASPAPSAPALAARANYGLIHDAAVLTADLLRLLGCNMNFAPMLDLDHFPDVSNATSGRSWGRDPQRVIDYAGHWNRWLRKRSIATCGKHFPGGGRATSDPHHDLPRCNATLEELLREDILPFTALMPELDSIMLAHIEFPILDSDYPASLSSKIIRGLLRGQLGFDHHLVMTDDLDMGAITKRFGRGEDAKRAIEAGNDLAMICHNTESADLAAQAIANLPITIQDEAHERVERFRHKALNGPLLWSDSHWEKTVSGLAELAGTLPDFQSAETSSPVADY